MHFALFDSHNYLCIKLKIEMETGYFDDFEQKLEQELLKLCTNQGMLDGGLLATDDINDRWRELAPEYMADAVPQIRDYPTVSVAWAAYLGMAVANGWDADWELHSRMTYKSYYGLQGFDDMDDHIVNDVLGIALNSDEASKLESVVRLCGETAVSFIRHEQIDPQTPTAFHIFARACKVMFRIGAALELKRLGYKFEKVYLS